MVKKRCVPLAVIFLVAAWQTVCLAAGLSPEEVQRLVMENKDKIPPLIVETLPSGAVWVSHMYARNYGLDTRVDMQYSAAKPNTKNDPLYPNTGYHLECHVIVTGDFTGEALAKNFMPREVERLKALAKVESVPQFYRTATENDTAWGKSVKVREIYTPMGQGEPKSQTYYHFYAAGRIGNVLFKASATCMPDDTSRGDEWFAKLVEGMAKWSVSNLTI